MLFKGKPTRGLSDESSDEEIPADKILKARAFYRAASTIPFPREIPPTDLQDIMNNLHDAYKHDPEWALLFTAMVSDNTLEDEPNAPPLYVANPVDDEAVPPWEFYYTNLMFFGEGVERGDSSLVQGCNCRGSCKTNSKCACLLRQRQLYPEWKGFQYGTDGRLHDSDYPVVECNANCTCDADCCNRVRLLSDSDRLND